VLGWTGGIGLALFGAALIGWLALHGLPPAALAGLLAFGGAGMLYLTVTDLAPAAAQHHYQQSGALATACAFLLVLVFSAFV
jgi:zinc transporter ZupT